MISNNKNLVGVIGAGKFGVAIIRLLAKKSDVLVYVRTEDSFNRVEKLQKGKNPILPKNITLTMNLKDIADNCEIIFPVIPATSFRNMIIELAPNLSSRHTIIHCIKGFDVNWPKKIQKGLPKLIRDDVKTMSEIIKEETIVKKIGCLAGPNLSAELLQDQPAATVIASPLKKVVNIGRNLLKNPLFQIYGSKDLLGVELCGAMKNIIAIAAGGLKGLGYGENCKALLISRGMIEMMYIGKFMGASFKPFIGLAGVGDLVATCSSELSRNFRLGFRMAQGEKLDDILKDIGEVVEGINTIKVVTSLARSYDIKAPISMIMYKVIFKNLDVNTAIRYLINYPLDTDIDFI